MRLLYRSKLSILPDKVKEEEVKEDVKKVVDVQLEDPLDTTGYDNASKVKEELDRDVKGQSARWPDLQCKDCGYKTSSSNDLDTHAAKVHGINNHPCKQCGREFSQGKFLRKHEKIHETGYQKLKCEQCSYESHNPCHLKAHVEAVHDKVKQFSCKLCDYAGSYKYALKRHLTKAHGNLDEDEKKNILCKICGSGFTNNLNLQKHVERAHDKRDEKKFGCKECPYATDTKNYLRKHMNRVHKIHMKNIEIKSKQEIQDNVVEEKALARAITTKITAQFAQFYINSEGIKIFKCNFCQYESSEKDSLKSHRFSMHILGDTKIKSKLTEQLQREQRVRKKVMNKYVCNKCDYATARSKSALKSHMKDYHEKEGVNCKLKYEQCSQQSSNKSNLALHVKSVHKKIRDSVCEECGRFYSSPGTLKKHIEAVHCNGNKKFKCNFCSFATSHLDSLRNHNQRLHEEGKKKYVCEECGYMATVKFDFKKHQEVHKDAEEREKFKCEQCPREFFDKRHVRRHVKVVHENLRHLCKDCGFTAIRMTTLKLHIESIHEKFKCDQWSYESCNKSYSPQRPSEQRHLVVKI